jgi:site-specific DNA recombinase
MCIDSVQDGCNAHTGGIDVKARAKAATEPAPIDLEIPRIIIPDPLPFPLAEARGRSGVYARISQQDSPAVASLKTQAQAGIDRNIDDRFIVRPEHVWFDRQSGYHTEHLRPKLIEAKQAVLRGELDRLTVYSTDRLARSDDLKFIVRWFERRGCEVVFITFERPKGHVGDFMLDTMAFAHTHEVISIRDRTDRGRSDLRELGVLLGCGPCRYGYIWDKDGRSRIAHPDHAPIVVLIFDLVGNKGWSTIKVAQYLNDQEVPSPYMSRENRRNPHKQTKWSPTRISYIIRERTYLGVSLEGRTEPVVGEDGERMRVMYRDKLRTVRKPVDPGEYREASNSTTERLIDDDLFARANAVLSDKKWKTARTRNDRDLWLLRGLVFCAHCGFRMSPQKVATRGSKPRHYYHCSTRRMRFRHDRAQCSARLIRREELDDAVWAKVEGLIRHPEQVRAQIERAAAEGNADLIATEVKDLDKDLAQARRRLKQYEEAYMDATNTRLRKLAEDRVEEAEHTVKELESRRDTLALRLRPYQELEATKARIMDLVEAYARAMDDPAWLTPQRRREVLEGLGVTVHASHNEIKLKWRPPVSLDPSVVLPISIP